MLTEYTHVLTVPYDTAQSTQEWEEHKDTHKEDNL